MGKFFKLKNFLKLKKRRLIQLFTALIYNAHLKGVITGEIYQGNLKFACVPGLNCYSCPAAIGACPLGALQNALSASSHRIGWYVFGIIILYGVLLGRTVCGWLCPFGLIQELLYKIKSIKIKKSKITRSLSYFKYFILVFLVIAWPLYDMLTPAFCKYICPAGTLEGAVVLLANPNNFDLFNILGFLFAFKFIIMLIVILTCILCYRAFCRFICPLGALYGFFNKINIAGVKVNMKSCNHCGACVRKCRMDVKCVGDRECIQCGECADICPKNAIFILKRT